MIWFECKQCGKKHGRPENTAGSLIFCDCGLGITVPWESTVEEPEVVMPVEPEAPPVPPSFPAAPRMIPVPVGEERIPVELRPRREEPVPVVRRAARRRPSIIQRDRNFCFNHQTLPIEKTCESCGERFCAHCLVTFQGKVLCGPCKNFLVRLLDEPPKVSVLAVMAAFLGVALSVAGFCLFPLGMTGDVMPLVVLTLLLQLVILGLSGLALYRTSTTSVLHGRSMALTGLLAASIGIVLTLAATIYSYMQWV